MLEKKTSRGHPANRGKQEFYNFLIEILKKNQKTNAKEFIPLCEIKTGRTEDNIKASLETLEKAGFVEILNGVITFIEDKRF